jgi:hypothetical protein
MSWAACCSNKQMQDMFFGESSSMMFRDAAKGRREAPCQWCFEQVQMFVVGKSLIWVCDNCKGVSEACEKCGTPVRQQTIRKDNYKTCSMCFKKDFKVGFVFVFLHILMFSSRQTQRSSSRLTSMLLILRNSRRPRFSTSLLPERCSSFRRILRK